MPDFLDPCERLTVDPDTLPCASRVEASVVIADVQNEYQLLAIARREQFAYLVRKRGRRKWLPE
jgi:hypothetical protein